MNSARESDIFSSLERGGLIAVPVIESAEDAVPVAGALLAGGVNAIELTLRSPVAIKALWDIRRALPEMLVGMGTILTIDQVREVHQAGAAFGVSPGMNPRIVEAAIAAGLPFAPGIVTPSDIALAWEYQRKFLKFFPAEPSGGLAYLNSIAAPYAHLGIKYLPLGGLTEVNAGLWLGNAHVLAIGGSWIAPKNLIAAKNWSAITENARRAVAIRLSARV